MTPATMAAQRGMPVARLTQIYKFKRPHDLKPFKHDFDGIVDRETFADTLAPEISFVRGSPPRKTAVAAAVIPRKWLIDVAQRLDLDMRNLNDATGQVLAVNDHTKVSRLEQGFTALGYIAEQARCRAFRTCDDLRGKFVCKLCPITKPQDDMLCMPNARRNLVRVPEPVDVIAFVQVVRHFPRRSVAGQLLRF